MKHSEWVTELSAAKKMVQNWHKQANKIVKKYKGAGTQGSDINLFHANVSTVDAMLYGNTPKIDVSRRYADPDDDVGRVAGLAMERLLNLDLANHGSEIESALRSALQDRLLSGLGVARVRYELETQQQEVQLPTGGTAVEEQVTHEAAPIEYYFWGDVLWPWARNWSELRWLGYRNYLNKEEVTERFSEEVANELTYKSQTTSDEENTDEDRDGSDNDKTEIYEIWDKTKREVVWLSIEHDKILETKPDPLKLSGFFPSPPFFMANPTTSLYMPTPDYVISQDLYNEVDKLQTRISIITEAVKVVGVYDASAVSLQQMFTDGVDNQLIPVDNWALFAEKGGVKGQIDWFPLVDVVAALDKLRELRTEAIGLLQQVTGMSDIMRGELGGQYEGVGQSQLKAKFGSIRIQKLQDQFAQFASDLMQIKAEIVCRHFEPKSIAKMANLETLKADQELIMPAIGVLKDYDTARIKVDIRPESIAMTDFSQLKNERVEYINALAIFMQSAQPIMESDPTAKPFMLQLLQWGLAGFKGSAQIEGVIDKAIDATTKAAQQNQDKPDPEQAKMQAQMQLEQAKAQAKMQEIEAKKQADMATRQTDMQADIQTAQQEHAIKMQQMQGEIEVKLAEINAKMQANLALEKAQLEGNVIQARAASETEIHKDVANQQLELEKEATKTALKIQEIAAASAGKVREAKNAK